MDIYRMLPCSAPTPHILASRKNKKHKNNDFKILEVKEDMISKKRVSNLTMLNILHNFVHRGQTVEGGMLFLGRP